MKQAYPLLFGLMLMCQQALSQKVVQLHRYDAPLNISGHMFAGHSFYLNKDSFFEVLSLKTGTGTQVEKPPLPRLLPGSNMGSLGSSLLFAGTGEQGAYIADSSGSSAFDRDVVIRQLTPRINSTFVLYTLGSEGYKLIEVDNKAHQPSKFWITGERADIKIGYSDREDVLYFSNTFSPNTVALYASDGTALLRDLQISPDEAISHRLLPQQWGRGVFCVLYLPKNKPLYLF